MDFLIARFIGSEKLRKGNIIFTSPKLKLLEICLGTGSAHSFTISGRKPTSKQKPARYVYSRSPSCFLILWSKQNMRLLFLLLVLFGPKFLYAKVSVRTPEHYCIVTERHYSHRFNFSQLSSDDDFVIKHDRGVALRLQMCKPLNQKCHNEEGYSVCLSRHGQEFGIGKEPPEVDVEFGEIKFKYTGDQCDKTHKYTINITMICDYEVQEGNGMKLFATDYNECDFNLDWRTKYACISERKQMNCSVHDKTGYYDLNSLVNLSNNYEVFINDTLSIILNVCHSVLYGPNTCKATSAACLVDKTLNSQRLSDPLGEPVDNLRYNSEDKSLSLTYENGKLCNFPNTNETQIKTTITFFCDLSATGTLPEYVGGMENCHYKLIWKTAAACSEKALHAKSLEKQNVDVCTVKNPLLDEVFSLRPLMGKEFSVKYPGINDLYKFSICSPLNNTCKSGSGACRLHKSISGGMVNSQLMWKESGLYLNYTNGDLCYKKIQRYTIIEFYCGEKEDFEIDEQFDLCYDVIKMSTNLVCPKKKKSCATYGNEMNFEGLARENSSYSIKLDNVSEYHINVCQPLKKNFNCDGAAICKTTISNEKTTTVNLGNYIESPIRTTDQSAVLIYKNGSICEDDKKKRIESIISFLCDINVNKGNPVFKKYENCTYYFEWKTRIACGKVEGSLNKNCTLTNDLGDQRSLSVLSGPGNLFHNIKKFNEEHKNYIISFCNHNNVCNGTVICDDKKNYGTEVSVLFDYTVDLIELKFTKGSKCNDGSFSESTLTMICKEDYSINGIDLLYEGQCHVDFEWRTNLICKSSQTALSHSLDQFAGEKTTNSLSGGEIAIIVIVILVLLFAIGYFQNAARRTHFIDMITNSTSRNRDRVRYSRVNTMEEVHLLLNASDPTVIDSDSDDDLLEA